MADSYDASAPKLGENTASQALQHFEHDEVDHDIKQDLNGMANPEKLPQHTHEAKKKARRKVEGPVEICCAWLVQHQTGLAVNLMTLLFLTHMSFPRARKYTRKFFELSYYNSKTGNYCIGWNDAFMVAFWIVLFTGLRAAVMDYVLEPWAKRHGVKSERDQTRFAEQAWLMVYYSVFWTLGMYIWITSDYWLNLEHLWINWPNREMNGINKWYILVQYSFWLQQILIVHIEERRKDHWQMLTHHIVTTALIFTSYGYHQTKVGNVILCLMDAVDLFFPLAKCLKYLGFTTLCDVLFGFFMVTWIAARHFGYLTICYSLYSDLPRVINYGCYRGKNGAITGPFPAPDQFGHLLEPFRDPEGVVCFNNKIMWGFLSALLFLQGITIMWFTMIVKVAINVLRGGEADDIRSDDEDEDEGYEDEEEEEIETKESLLDAKKIPQPIEEEVGVEAINLKNRASKYRKPVGSSTTGVSLDRELLGRIGCEKGVEK